MVVGIVEKRCQSRQNLTRGDGLAENVFSKGVTDVVDIDGRATRGKKSVVGTMHHEIDASVETDGGDEEAETDADAPDDGFRYQG